MRQMIGFLMATALGLAPGVAAAQSSGGSEQAQASALAPAQAPTQTVTTPLRNPNSTPEWDALYKERFDTLMRNKGVILDYDPMEPVEGAVRSSPLPVARLAGQSIRQEALDTASAYAAASKARAFMVWRGGAVQRADYFQGTTRETPIVSKSLSKPLTAIAVGRAIALGKIRSVDQPVADFIPEWRGTPKAAIKVRHLLDMRSGLLEQMVSDHPDHPINRAYIDPDHGWHLIHNYPLTHAPGSYYGYGNATSELVAVVIERATGQRYGDFVSQEILKPIGAMGGRIWVSRAGGLAHAGCCMTLPAESWLRLGILLLDDGKVKGKRLLPAGFVDAMATGTSENPHYGMGVWVAGPYTDRRGFGAVGKPGPKVLHGQPYRDKDLFLFDGNANQTVYISRAAKLVVLRVGDAPPKTPEWDNSMLPNLVMDGIVWKKGEARPTPQAAR